MKFAIVNGEKAEAQQGLRGACVHCQSETIAKCGTERIEHWAHKSKVSCDPWWENETEWHRAWKKDFPKDWQEISHFDSKNEEKHIADIKTDKGFVIEFQHSAITDDEIKSREDFYKNMVWVVDGTRLPMDYRRFCKGSDDFDSGVGQADFSSSNWEGVFSAYFPEECFPKRWLTSSVPVYFDFLGIAPLEQPDEKSAFLWGLLPGDVDGWSVVVKLRRKDFIERSLTAPDLLLAPEIRSHMEQERAKEEENLEQAERREEQRVDPLQQLLIIQRQRRGRYRL
jgi:hypothetical protein